jgi:hypothetical protein
MEAIQGEGEFLTKINGSTKISAKIREKQNLK